MIWIIVISIVVIVLLYWTYNRYILPNLASQLPFNVLSFADKSPIRCDTYGQLYNSTGKIDGGYAVSFHVMALPGRINTKEEDGYILRMSNLQEKIQNDHMFALMGNYSTNELIAVFDGNPYTIGTLPVNKPIHVLIHVNENGGSANCWINGVLMRSFTILPSTFTKTRNLLVLPGASMLANDGFPVEIQNVRILSNFKPRGTLLEKDVRLYMEEGSDFEPKMPGTTSVCKECD